MITIRSNAGKLGQSMRRLARRYPLAVKAGTLKTAIDAQLLFEKTVTTWSRPSAFRIEEARGGYKVGTDDAIYGYVDKGTRAHTIVPRQAKILHWTGPYKPKTRVGVISSYAGGRGSEHFWARKVRHPGTEPRRFSRIIRERVQPKAAGHVRSALREAHSAEGITLRG